MRRRLPTARFAPRRRGSRLAVGLLLALAGCGPGPGAPASGVSLRVSTNFGAQRVAEASSPRTPRESVQGYAERELAADPGDRGVLESLQTPRSADGSPSWFAWVNGSEVRGNAVRRPLHSGDRVWWDRHPAGQARSIPAIVGSYPEPFRSGFGGQRVPVRVDCGDDVRAVCDDVRARLTRIGVTASPAELGAVAGESTLRILVGTVADLGRDAAADALAAGPARSGIYVRSPGPGRPLQALDAAGRPARDLGPGTGLLAATRVRAQQPTWMVTGTDPAGVRAAASALEEGTLAGRLAVAVVDGRAVALPLAGR